MTLDNETKNLLLENYRTAYRYVGLDLDFIKRQIKLNTESTKSSDLTAKQVILACRDKALDDEIEINLRVSGSSLFNDFPVDPALPQARLMKIIV